MRNWFSSVYWFHHESGRYMVDSWDDRSTPPYVTNEAAGEKMTVESVKPHTPGTPGAPAASRTCAEPPLAGGAVPVLGHGLRLVRDPLAFMSGLREHGDVVRLRLGPKTVYAVTTPALTGALALSPDFEIDGPLWESLEGLLGKEGVATANGPPAPPAAAHHTARVPARRDTGLRPGHGGGGARADRALAARRDHRLHLRVLPGRRPHRRPLPAARRLHGRARGARSASTSPPSSVVCTAGW